MPPRSIVVTRSVLLLFALCLAALGADKPSRIEVSIAVLAYKPAKVTVHVGDTIVWTNNDDRDHTVVATDGTFKSENIKVGKTFEYTFTKPGKFAYGCSYHPRMKGAVVVE